MRHADASTPLDPPNGWHTLGYFTNDAATMEFCLVVLRNSVYAYHRFDALKHFAPFASFAIIVDEELTAYDRAAIMYNLDGAMIVRRLLKAGADVLGGAMPGA